MRIVGVDPGVNGAIAMYDGETLSVDPFPKLKAKARGYEINWPELCDLLDIKYGGVDHAFIEQVGAMPGQGVSSMFKFGYAAGGIRGALQQAGATVHLVTPTKWKAKVGLTRDKDYSRTKAIELFPANHADFKLKKDADKAEAALIAWYGYNELGGIS